MLTTRLHVLGSAIVCVAFAACAREQAPSYDLVVAHGRVINPESGLDAVRHVGIRNGKIDVISEPPLTGVRVIDASGHVVSPGFIDLHEHGQQEESYRMMVRDGVTSRTIMRYDSSCWPCSCRSMKDRKSTRLNSSHGYISYAVFCLK